MEGVPICVHIFGTEALGQASEPGGLVCPCRCVVMRESPGWLADIVLRCIAGVAELVARRDQLISRLIGISEAPGHIRGGERRDLVPSIGPAKSAVLSINAGAVQIVKAFVGEESAVSRIPGQDRQSDKQNDETPDM